MSFMIETSARHIHLTAEAVEILYGKGAELTVKKMLSQPGQFATANENERGRAFLSAKKAFSPERT